MKKFKHLVFTLALLFSGIFANAQQDHLNPPSDIFTMYSYEFYYYAQIRFVLFKGLTERPEFRFLIRPSFAPESVLDIEFDRKSNKYRLIHQICDKKIWSNENLDQVKVVAYKKDISKEDVDMLKSLFVSALSKTKYPVAEDIGEDGVNYQFTIDDNGMKAGCVSTPSAGTKMFRLVDIGLQLIELAKDDENPVQFSDKLVKEITDLSNEIKKQRPLTSAKPQ